MKAVRAMRATVSTTGIEPRRAAGPPPSPEGGRATLLRAGQARAAIPVQNHAP